MPNPHPKIRDETCQLAKDQESLMNANPCLMMRGGIRGRRIGGLKPLKSHALDYQTKYSRKWSNEGRTIVALKRAGYTVLRFVQTQRKKGRAFSTGEPRTSGLIALDGRDGAKIVIVLSGQKANNAQRKRLKEFARRMKPIQAIEVWTWPIMARQPEIERIA